MKQEIKMPDLATTGAAIKIVRWLKQPGQPVKRGEFLLEIETDKSAMEVESSAEGILLETRVQPGSEAAAGDLIAILEVASVAPAPTASPVQSTEPTATPAAAPAPTAAGARPAGLFARNRAAAQTAPAEVRSADLALSPARRTAARRLQESKQSIPHFYLESSANVRVLIARREAAGPVKPAWDAYFVQAVSRALPRFERMAYRFEAERLVPQGTTDLGVAADLDGELFVVPVSAPATKDVATISRDIREAVASLRAGDPARRRVQPGVMTLSNLGSTGVERFTAIINPPEAAILAIGRIGPVVVARGDTFAIEQRVALTLSVDHRVVNGKYAAEFLAAIVREIESTSA